MTRFATHKSCAGYYIVTDGINEVEVYSADYGYGTEWVASAVGILDLHSDPLPTKREAKVSAEYMLDNWEELRRA